MKISIKAKNMTTYGGEGSAPLVFHKVMLNVIIDGKLYVLKNSYDIENYLIDEETEWVGDQYEDMSAVEFTEKYTLDLIFLGEKTFEVE